MTEKSEKLGLSFEDFQMHLKEATNMPLDDLQKKCMELIFKLKVYSDVANMRYAQQEMDEITTGETEDDKSGDTTKHLH